MIRQRREALLLQPQRRFFSLAPRQAIDDAGIATVLLPEKLQQLLPRITLLGDAILDVGPIKAGDKLPRVVQAQSLNDLSTRSRISGGGQGYSRRVGETLLQHG